MGEHKHTPAELRAKLTLWLRKDAIDEFYLWGDGTEDRAEDAADMLDADAARIAELEAEIARKDEALKGARETILDLKNARWSEAEGTDAEWVAEIDAALSDATRDASEQFAQWINDGPALAKAAGCYVGITVSDYSALSNATTPETGGTP